MRVDATRGPTSGSEEDWQRPLTAAVMTVALAACGGGGDSGTSGGGGSSDTLTLGAIVPASTQSAADSRWANESPYMQAVYDTLVHLSPTGEPEPWLATEWSLNEDKTVLTLTLRTDVKFTDGEPFNADAAAQNILRFRDGTSPNASNLANVEDAKAVDDATLEITPQAARPGPARLPGPERRPDGEPEAVRRLGRADQAGRLGPLRPGHRQDRRRLQVRLHQERRLLGPRQRVLRQPGHHRPRGQARPRSTRSRAARSPASTSSTRRPSRRSRAPGSASSRTSSTGPA